VGRKSKLSEEQWAEVFRRRIEGESRRALAREFQISEASIREREEKNGKTAEVQQVARMIVATEAAYKSLPVTAQLSAQNLAGKLRSISESLASAADLGAKTSHRLQALANSEVGKVDDADPLSEDSMTALKGVSALTKLANDSASIALNLLAANKETVKELNLPKPEDEPPPPLRPQISREEWLKIHGHA
jgi:hypothetical protein